MAEKASSEDSSLLGGGAINEKLPTKKTFTSSSSDRSPVHSYDPIHNHAHLLHSIMGLDRYPNYLTRWSSNMQDIDLFEQAMKEQLQKIQAQKTYLEQTKQYMRDILQQTRKKRQDVDWTVLNPPLTWEQVRQDILHESASKAIFQSKQFRRHIIPNLHDVMDGNITVQLDWNLLEDWLSEEFVDVYSVPLLSRSFCIRLQGALQAIHEELCREDSMEEKNTPIMGNRPMDLDWIHDLSWVNNLLFHLVLKPLSRELFLPTESMEDLDWRHGYMVGYSNQPSKRYGTTRNFLIPHTDDSEVTLNIGMGDDDFEGGSLQFWNLRGSVNEGKFVGEFAPEMGIGLIHAGRHLHEVKPVTKGNRYALIVWARSWRGVRKRTCPCCWIHRRSMNERCLCQEG